MWGVFVGSLKDFLEFLGHEMPEVNVALRTSLQAKLGRWATTMRKDIAARRIERRDIDEGMHQEKTTEKFYLGKTCAKRITWSMV